MIADAAELLGAWHLDFSGTDAAAGIAGSPERAAARCVVLDRAGSRWVLEQIHPDNRSRKQAVAERLDELAGLPQIHSYRRTPDGSFFAGDCMLRPYVDGMELPRPGWLDDPWRLTDMARFLVQLREKTDGWDGPKFSIAVYAAQRMTAWRMHRSALSVRLEHSFQTLEKTFFPFHDRLPSAFCHGDFHPMNMVWGEADIRSVIDWEFCGMKPELYDAALLTGCVGFEDPDNLIRGPLGGMLKTLRSAGFGSEESWECFLEMVTAIRFGWMSEWLRRGDDEAVEMETVYLDILTDQRDYILERMF